MKLGWKNVVWYSLNILRHNIVYLDETDLYVSMYNLVQIQIKIWI